MGARGMLIDELMYSEGYISVKKNGIGKPQEMRV
jgi:hypothetical protein